MPARSVNPQSFTQSYFPAGIDTDLSIIADALHERQNRLYEYLFLVGLRGSFARKLHLFPERYQPYPRFSIRTLREFDDKITARY